MHTCIRHRLGVESKEEKLKSLYNVIYLGNKYSFRSLNCIHTWFTMTQLHYSHYMIF